MLQAVGERAFKCERKSGRTSAPHDSAEAAQDGNANPHKNGPGTSPNRGQWDFCPPHGQERP
jgi:hypothetical protein